MPTRKLPDINPMYRIVFCQHPEHWPPGAAALQPGYYEHECPKCNKKTIFAVSGVKCDSRRATK